MLPGFVWHLVQIDDFIEEVVKEVEACNTGANRSKQASAAALRNWAVAKRAILQSMNVRHGVASFWFKIQLFALCLRFVGL